MNLSRQIKNLKNSEIKSVISNKIKEFENNKNIFNELCFCILTANSTAERCISVQEKIGDGFLNLPEKELIDNLKKYSCRFYNKRAKYILEARKHKISLDEKLNTLNEQQLREWLVENIKGIGFKESSHFLRNIGYKNLAIIDFHIIDIMIKNSLIKQPKNLNKKNYLEIEKKLKILADNLNLSLAELDLYLWYLETGKILK